MTFQSTVSLQQGFGVPGDNFNDSPWRAQTFTINTTSHPEYNIVGSTMCTITAQGQAEAGGTGQIAGLIVNSKAYALQGDGSNTLAPSLTLPNYTEVECLTMGSVVVALPAAANIGDVVIFNQTTGAISTQVNTADLPSGYSFANAFVDYFTVTGAGLGVITFTPQQNPYVAQ